eukprot:jgi/Ulvmu1/8693/UM047_0033.1
MPPKKNGGRPAGPAGSTIPGVKTLLQSCLKAMAIEVERLSDEDDVAALRKVFDNALIKATRLKRALGVAGLSEWGDTAYPIDSSSTDSAKRPTERGLAAVDRLFVNDCFTMQEKLASHQDTGVPNYELDPVMGMAMKKAMPMVEVRILFATMARKMASNNAANQGRKTLFLIQPPAEDYGVVIFVNRVCVWETADGPVPVLDVAYMHSDRRDVSASPDNPVAKTIPQLIQSAANGQVNSIETEFTTDGAKAVALVLERSASILGAKTCEALKSSWTLPPFAARRMSATAILPIKVLGSEDIHKVERKGGRSCAQCSKGLPMTASKCSACQEAFYCDAGCQKAHWPSHKRTCQKSSVVNFDDAMEVNHGHNPFSSTQRLPSDFVSATMSMNGKLGTYNPRDVNKAGKLPAMPASGFIIKVQVGLDHPERSAIVIYPRGKRFETFVPVDAPCHRPLCAIVRARGFSGLKLYMWALRKSDEKFCINFKDLPDQDQSW